MYSIACCLYLNSQRPYIDVVLDFTPYSVVLDLKHLAGSLEA
jgi:hypothetical protein